MKKPGQNLIEFVFVLPLLLAIIFGIIELAMFWRAVHTVQNIALQAGVNAANQVVLGDQTSTSLSDLNCSDGTCYNFAVAKAVNVLQKKQTSLAIKNLSMTCSIQGSSPYALYRCNSHEMVQSAGQNRPRLSILLDYRDVNKNGVIVQLLYQYKTLFFGAAIPLSSGRSITIIPKIFEISSTKIQQYVNY